MAELNYLCGGNKIFGNKIFFGAKLFVAARAKAASCRPGLSVFCKS